MEECRYLTNLVIRSEYGSDFQVKRSVTFPSKGREKIIAQSLLSLTRPTSFSFYLDCRNKLSKGSSNLND